ncbi:LEPR-XLL domain-containing protein [Thalassoroseus pseudoceratinae]|uniref:LEPR-XLL domain-containing protein n=1 Tax=Thalassoroseus pseudoceratinae TaxID=2713176 RepID=UPI0014212FE7|nr:LEPR-XLL domain-containing protein [Thalassoroseus pseudoceratinae]
MQTQTLGRAAVRRRRHYRSTAPCAAEVLEPRVLLSAASVSGTVVSESAVNDGSYESLVTGDYNADGIDDFFFWNPETGFNRLVDGQSGEVMTNIVAPGAIDEYSEAAAGQFTDREGLNPGEELFIWDPATGQNWVFTLSVSPETDGEAIYYASALGFENSVVMQAVNGNDFSDVVAGRFRGVQGEAEDDLFFWNPQTGQNRIVGFTRSFNNDPDFGGPAGILISDDPLPRAAINGTDYTELAVGDVDGNTREMDELFFWNPGTGRNRLASFIEGEVSSIADNPIAPEVGNGNAYNRVVIGDFDGDGDGDLYFQDSVTGNNRFLTNESVDPDLMFSFETNVAAPGAVNGFPLIRSVNRDTIADDVYLWDPISGTNRLLDLMPVDPL